MPVLLATDSGHDTTSSSPNVSAWIARTPATDRRPDTNGVRFAQADATPPWRRGRTRQVAEQFVVAITLAERGVIAKGTQSPDSRAKTQALV